MNKTSLSLLLSILLLSYSCDSKRERKKETIITHETADSISLVLPEISFFHYEEKNDYPDAIIEMYTPLSNQSFRPGKVPFEFNIKNYPFAEGLSGFQLNLILNSGDPIGYNMPIFQRELKEGTYRAVAYLIDPEGLALKEFGNYIDRDFTVGDTRAFPYFAEPSVFLNLPKNQQSYSPEQEVIIDFLVVGGDMKADGLKVQISVNEFSYEIEEMTPVRVANLPKGEYRLYVNLVRKDGKELDGAFSRVSKTIIIE
ncbi:hypothetical protein P872_00270 [Rhodonellum psychrophilum GCM71 = DSM 17998]|uniref:Uncharacterized protein n=2 Tax=Rhodonellum TaxID=336827 RepID=U5C160_9BACT|nr:MULTISPECIES: hypothetical protein [Rhodonellum]ERM83544.1 hypothetical protein P872_00270 [Rhodonellum psychrophilum GCM71 = DSM 17998]SDY52553.1 hypothetical protein SAMN05444412_101423 [Rhodonellum ikkaensis]